MLHFASVPRELRISSRRSNVLVPSVPKLFIFAGLVAVAPSVTLALFPKNLKTNESQFCPKRGLPGTHVSDHWNIGTKCFAVYTHHDFPSRGGKTIHSCQGGKALDVKDHPESKLVTFRNIKENDDQLVIPTGYYRDAKELVDSCQDDASLIRYVAEFCKVGFRELIKNDAVPAWKKDRKINFCFHIPPHISVHWAHMHVFHTETVHHEVNIWHRNTVACGHRNRHDRWTKEETIDWIHMAKEVLQEVHGVRPINLDAVPNLIASPDDGGNGGNTTPPVVAPPNPPTSSASSKIAHVAFVFSLYAAAASVVSV